LAAAELDTCLDRSAFEQGPAFVAVAAGAFAALPAVAEAATASVAPEFQSVAVQDCGPAVADIRTVDVGAASLAGVAAVAAVGTVDFEVVAAVAGNASDLAVVAAAAAAAAGVED